MGTPIDRTAKAALDTNLSNGIVSDAPKQKANNDTLYNYADTLNAADEAHANAAVLPHADGSVTGPKIKDGAVATTKIADGAVTTPKLADGSVTGTKFADSTITSGKIANGAVTSEKLADGSVYTPKIVDGSITEGKIATGAVTTSKIATGALDGRYYTEAEVEAKLTERDNRIDKIVAQAGTDNTEIVDSRGGYPVLKSRLDNVDAQLAHMTNVAVEDESAQLGAELLDSTGWTTAGWTGDFTTGFVHTVGLTSPLRRSVGLTGTKLYQISITVNSATPETPPGWFTVSIGNSQSFDTYRGGGTVATYEFGIQSVSDGDLVITPVSAFDGSITNISVKEIITPINPTLAMTDSTGANTFETRPTAASLDNVYLGKDTGEYNTTGDSNVGIGAQALSKNTSGFWSVGIGRKALNKNTTGSRNVGIGYIALENNISGHRNVAIGSFSMHSNTHGANNIAIGADSLQFNTTGNYNIALGTIALYGNKTGHSNVGIGYTTLSANESGGRNIAIGDFALAMHNTGSNNIAIGYNAAVTQSGDVQNLAIGSRALYRNGTGTGNVALGNSAGEGVSGASYNHNTFIGYQSGFAANSSTHNNVVVGSQAGYNLKASNNVLIGALAGNGIITGSDNIVIGYNQDTPAPDSIGKLNIGGLLRGDLVSQKLGIRIETPTAILHLGAATAATPSLKIDASALMTTLSAGSIEFDGTNLYFTDNTNTRRRLAVAA